MWSCWNNFFTWTDEWFTGGQEITDWAFGIVTRDRRPKKAFYILEEKLGSKQFHLASSSLAEGAVRFGNCCSYNGGPTLASCLDSLGKLNYPSMRSFWSMTDRPTIHLTSQRSFHRCATFIKAIQGLSHARNTGAATARGKYSPTPIPTAWLIRTGSIISLALWRRDYAEYRANHAYRVPMR